MENPKKDTVSLQSAGQLSGVELDASVVCLGAGEEQQDKSQPASGPKIQPDVPPDVQPDITTNVPVDVQPDITTDVPVDVQPDITPEVSVDVQPDITPEVSVDVQPDITPEVSVDVQPDITPEVSVDVQPDIPPDVQVDVQPDITPDVPADVQPDIIPNFLADVRHEPTSDPSPLALIKFRIQQLHNRRFMLEKIQDFIKKAQERRLAEGGTEEVTGEEDDQMHELEAIDKELAELQLRKAELELEEQGERSKLGNNRDHEADLTWFESEAPRGGIYMLPHVNIDEPPEPQIPPQPLIAVEDLAETPGYTQCPTCEEYVVTNTRKKVGELAWILCCLCSMFGGVAGCCLIPFYMDSTKNFHHHCPRCQSHIHTYHQW